MFSIRLFADDDWEAVWQILKPVFRAGETYPYPPDISEVDAKHIWTGVPLSTFVALSDDSNDVLGTYYLKPNQPGLGSHVCNCGYVVGLNARGKGIASEMCRHSQQIARDRGFRAMQYNLVVSTNEAAVRLWKRLGFEVVGVLPEAFRHPRAGLVDAFVMYKLLDKQTQSGS